MSGFVTGYSDEAEFCPFCGSKIYEWRGDGGNLCDECKKIFYVIEGEEEGRNEVNRCR